VHVSFKKNDAMHTTYVYSVSLINVHGRPCASTTDRYAHGRPSDYEADHDYDE